MYKILITTTDSDLVCEKISNSLVEEKLSACVQKIKNIESKYLWDGLIQNQKEYMLLIKCKQVNVSKVSESIIQNHNYEVPEIISLDIDVVNEKYSDWLNQNC